MWNPPATDEELELTASELAEYLLSRSLDLEYVQAGGRTLIEG